MSEGLPAEEEPGVSIQDLPLPVLGRILELAGRSAGPCVSSVCRRWRDLLYSSWHTLRIEAGVLDHLTAAQQRQWFAAKRRLVERVAPAATGFAVHDHSGLLAGGSAATGGWAVADLLALLLPGQLADLELECHPVPDPAALSALPRLAPSLTALNIDCRRLGDAGAAAGAAAALRQLLQLRSLRLGMEGLPDCILPAVLSLSRLTRLELESLFFPLPPLAPLTTLCALRHLRLVDDSRRGSPLALPPPASFAGGQGLACLTAYMNTLCQVAGSQMGFLYCYCGSPPAEQGSTQAAVSLDCRAPRGRLTSLPALLAALLPAGAALQCLQLEGCQLESGELLGCGAQLAALNVLKLGGCSSAAGSLGEALEALLLQAPLLAELDIAGSLGGEVPACLSLAPSCLRRLALVGNELAGLPGGRWLPGLEELDLGSNQLERLPPALTAATRLSRLRLAYNAQLALDGADVVDTLAHLPRLRELDLAGTATPAAVLQQLRLSLPQLQVQS